MSDVTMQELELETAELLPSRETLGCHRPCGGGGSSVFQIGLVNVNNVLNNNNIFVL